MNNNFELLNAEGLDESISNTMGLEYSDFCCGADGQTAPSGEGKPKIDPALIAQGAATLGGIIKNISANRKPTDEELFARCDKKPGILAGKKKKEKWEKCKNDFYAEKSKAADAELEKQRLIAQQEQIRLEQQRLGAMASKDSGKSSDDKFLGMPKAVGITVAIVGGIAVLVGGFFLVKKLRK
jgi:hypothetical protein